MGEPGRAGYRAERRRQGRSRFSVMPAHAGTHDLCVVASLKSSMRGFAGHDGAWGDPGAFRGPDRHGAAMTIPVAASAGGRRLKSKSSERDWHDNVARWTATTRNAAAS
jgi:hypothetical protein